MLRRILCVLLASLLAAVAAAAAAAEPGASGLPLPRFVSLSADRANLRTGPGFRYPIAWVFLRRAMPVEVVGEFEQWRRIRDRDGAEGWIHKALLSGRRTVTVIGGERGLRSDPHAASPLRARAEAGVQGRLLACRGDWCELRAGGVRGWIPRGHLWGVYAGERFE